MSENTKEVIIKNAKIGPFWRRLVTQGSFSGGLAAKSAIYIH
jgi:hypothetical protein